VDDHAVRGVDDRNAAGSSQVAHLTEWHQLRRPREVERRGPAA
jgi:hypothetical protein